MFDITNERSFWNLIGVLLLTFYGGYYSNGLMKSRKGMLYKKSIWWIAYSMLILDISVDLMFSATNLFESYSFPVIGRLPWIFLIVIMYIYALIYMLYFQWNILCIYKIGKMTLPLSQQLLCQKGSAIDRKTSLSVGASRGNTKSNYESAKDQAGIRAGKEGIDEDIRYG